MRRLIAISFVIVTFAGAGYVESRQGAVEGITPSTGFVSYNQQGPNATQGPPMERLERTIKMKRGSKTAIGAFALASGRRIELFTAETEDAHSCLIEHDTEAGAGAGCLEGGLFAARKVAFSVNTDGGPERFDELYVVGVVAPSIRSAALVLTDGREVPLRLAGEGSFLFEGSRSDLAEGTYPHQFRLFGPNGKLVETVSFPPAGS
jgi:hypothetical protein